MFRAYLQFIAREHFADCCIFQLSTDSMPHAIFFCGRVRGGGVYAWSFMLVCPSLGHCLLGW